MSAASAQEQQHTEAPAPYEALRVGGSLRVLRLGLAAHVVVQAAEDGAIVAVREPAHGVVVVLLSIRFCVVLVGREPALAMLLVQADVSGSGVEDDTARSGRARTPAGDGMRAQGTSSVADRGWAGSSDTPRVSRRACGTVNVQDIRSCEQQPSALERADAHGDGHTRVEGVHLRPHPAELSHCDNIWCPSVRSASSFSTFLLSSFYPNHARKTTRTHARTPSPRLSVRVGVSLSSRSRSRSLLVLLGAAAAPHRRGAKNKQESLG